MEGETYTLFPRLRKHSFIYTNIIISKLVKEEENLKEILIEFFLILHKTIHEKNNYIFK